MDERQRAAWQALGLGPIWVPRAAVQAGPTDRAQALPGQAGQADPGGRPAEPRAADPQPDGPHRADPQPADPQPADPQPAELQPVELQPVGLPLEEPQPDGFRPVEPQPDGLPPVEPQPLVRLEALRGEVAGCPKCRLARSRTQTVFGEGDPCASWMFVGEAPGAEEDARGEPFVGQSGRLLDAMLASIGLERTRDVYIANVVKCRPPGNRNPQPDEVASCEPYLHGQIALVRPVLLVLMGRFAAQALLRTTESVGALRGRVHRYDAGDFAVPAVVTYHPAYLLRTPADKAKAWRDLCAARAEHARLSAPARPSGPPRRAGAG